MSSVLALPQSNVGFDWSDDKSRTSWHSGGDSGDTSGRGHSDGKSWFRSGLPTPPRPKVMNEVTPNQQLPSHAASHTQRPPRIPHQDASSSNLSARPRSDNPSHSETPTQSDEVSTGHRHSRSQDWSFTIHNGTSNSIASYLQIPESVNKSKGSLAEFAAEITCLFWFETATTLQFAEDIPNISFVDHGLVPDATPSVGFRKWVTTILSTTQVGKNVILLALMFIYRLKKFNPSVSGKRGSEFRLLTIALMLANKFLDDNTYTNKTWAEVSGISVNEIHIMEVEFLSNMRYDLYASDTEWAEWKIKLGKFGAFYERASSLPAPQEVRQSGPLTPSNQSFPHKMPSPPSTHYSAPSYPTPLSATSANSPLPNPLMAVPYLPRSPARHHRNPVLEHLERKRSMDFSGEMPPAKRMYQQQQAVSPTSTAPTPVSSDLNPDTATSYTSGFIATSSSFAGDSQSTGQRVLRLPVPKIQTVNSLSNTQLAPISFPGGRAMSTVYPNPSAAWSQPITPISGVPPASTNLYQNPIPNLGDMGREHSSYISAQASPSYGAVTPTRPGLSPSYFLTNRSSPYRPVRGVNTLLIPSSSASMQNPVRNIPFDQMRYQPLSKANTDRRSGPVPYYQPEGWQQSNASTPLPLQQYTNRI